MIVHSRKHSSDTENISELSICESHTFRAFAFARTTVAFHFRATASRFAIVPLTTINTSYTFMIRNAIPFGERGGSPKGAISSRIFPLPSPGKSLVSACNTIFARSCMHSGPGVIRCDRKTRTYERIPVLPGG